MPRREYDREAVAAGRRLRSWVQGLTPREAARAEALPLRRDMLTMLTYVRDHRLKGTQSTGSFKLKDIRAITADFVDPPVLDQTIGGRTYRLRTEYDVWPLFFLHVLAEVGGLLEGREARRWRLTASGSRFLTSPPPVQIWFMLTCWWEGVDWVIAFPMQGMGESLLPAFKSITRSHLLTLPVDARIPYETFADELIEETGMTWTSADPSFHRSILHTAVHRLVISVLDDFGVLEPAYEIKPNNVGTKRELAAFQVTPFGHGLLASLGEDW
jgi:hypothetical protein